MKMKALSLNQKENLTLLEREKPIAQKGEAVLKILTVAICGSDIHAYHGRQAIFEYPRVLGHELCGIIEEINDNESDLKVGDKVVVIPYEGCGTCIACRKGKGECCESLTVLGVHKDGGQSEFMVAQTKYLIKVDKEMDALSACLIEPFSISAHSVHRADVKCGENVLVIGAGFIGIGAAEIAKSYGANIIIADVSDDRREFAKKTLHYEHVLDPLEVGYREKLEELTDGDMPDTIIDATGNSSSMSGVFDYLSAGGKVVYVGIAGTPLNIIHTAMHKRQADVYASRAATRFDFEYVIHCMQEGKIQYQNLITDIINFDDNIIESFKGLMDKKEAMFKGVIVVSS